MQVPIADFVLSDDTICVGDSVIFISQSQYTDFINWDLSNGYTSNSFNFTYEFLDTTTVDVNLQAFSNNGCSDTIQVASSIIVINPPIADFFIADTNYNPNFPFAGSLTFSNSSLNSDFYYWDFSNNDESYETNPTYEFNFNGLTTSNFILYAYNGCGYDTATLKYEINYEKGLFVPNAIYPDDLESGINTFNAVATGLYFFHIKIFDTYGNLLWESDALNDKGEPTGGWDGTFNGKKLYQDVYVWKVEAIFKDKEVWKGIDRSNDENLPGFYLNKIFKTGTVTVIR